MKSQLMNAMAGLWGGRRGSTSACLVQLQPSVEANIQLLIMIIKNIHYIDHEYSYWIFIYSSWSWTPHLSLKTSHYITSGKYSYCFSWSYINIIFMFIDITSGKYSIGNRWSYINTKFVFKSITSGKNSSWSYITTTFIINIAMLSTFGIHFAAFDTKKITKHWMLTMSRARNVVDAACKRLLEGAKWS